MSKHTPGPWFIWKERAMQQEGLEPDEIAFELLGYDDFDVMSGIPKGEITRGRITGCQTVVTLEADEFGDDEDSGRLIALANARLISAAPDLLEALRWYIENDDVYEMDGNEFWLEGRERARIAVNKATGEQA
jgi:hypothetical protein